MFDNQVRNLISEKAYGEIAKLIANYSMHCLDLGRISMTTEALQSVANGLAKNPRVTDLYLDGCDIYMDKAKIVGDIIRSNPKLKYIDLGNNNLDIRDGWTYIVSSLEVNNTLEAVWLRGQIFTKEAISAFCKMLEKNNTLNTLRIDGAGQKVEQIIQERVRTKFLATAITLFRSHVNPQTNSTFALLPPEILLHILRFYPILNKSEGQSYWACASFIYANIHMINMRLREGKGIYIHQKGQNFCFFTPAGRIQKDNLLTTHSAQPVCHLV